MDRESGNIPKSQMGFINFLVLPLYTSYGQEFPEVKRALEIIEGNLEYWKKEVDRSEQGLLPSEDQTSNSHSLTSDQSTPELTKRFQRTNSCPHGDSSSEEVICLDSTPEPVLSQVDSTQVDSVQSRSHGISSVFSILKKDKQRE